MKNYYYMNCRVMHDNGNIQWVKMINKAKTLNDIGNLISVLGVATGCDITVKSLKNLGGSGAGNYVSKFRVMDGEFADICKQYKVVCLMK